MARQCRGGTLWPPKTGQALGPAPTAPSLSPNPVPYIGNGGFTPGGTGTSKAFTVMLTMV